MAAVDEDKALSPTGKAEKKGNRRQGDHRAGEIASPRESPQRSREPSQALGQSPRPRAEAARKRREAMMHCEIRSHLASLKSGDSLAFIDAHASEVGDAVLSAPAFLSGLNPCRTRHRQAAHRGAHQSGARCGKGCNGKGACRNGTGMSKRGKSNSHAWWPRKAPRRCREGCAASRSIDVCLMSDGRAARPRPQTAGLNKERWWCQWYCRRSTSFTVRSPSVPD